MPPPRAADAPRGRPLSRLRRLGGLPGDDPNYSNPPEAGPGGYETSGLLAVAPMLGNLGYALSLTDRLDEAVATLRRAAAMPGRTATIEDNLGLVLLRRGDRAGAREAFQRAVALAPDDPRARAHLASLTGP